MPRTKNASKKGTARSKAMASKGKQETRAEHVEKYQEPGTPVSKKDKMPVTPESALGLQGGIPPSASSSSTSSSSLSTVRFQETPESSQGHSPERTQTKTRTALFKSPERERQGRKSMEASGQQTSPQRPEKKTAVKRVEQHDEEKEQQRIDNLFQSRKATPSRGISTQTKSELASSSSKQQDLLRQVYSIIRKKCGSLGGGGAGGAIYGEITQESFQRVVNCLKDRCEFTKDSVFIDVGAGLGKPNFHVAVNPGVKLSLGVEIIGGRWWQSICLLDTILRTPQLGETMRKVFFGHADVNDMNTFDPVTHVYSFNRGFPPEAMRGLARAFHASKSAKYFICFDKEKTVSSYGFDVTLVDYVATKMAGSGEQHRCYLYRRNDLLEVVDTPKPTETKSEPLIVSDRSPVRTRSRSKKQQSYGSRLIQVKEEDEEEKEREEDQQNENVAQTLETGAGPAWGWKLVAPPKQVEFAPHVPHGANYMKGLEMMENSLSSYLEWVQEQIGLHRSERSRRSKTRTSSSSSSSSSVSTRRTSKK